MYAIRSYYDTTEVIADQVNFLESKNQRTASSSNNSQSSGPSPYDYQTTSAPKNNVNRITSYNVCYTKLLRF